MKLNVPDWLRARLHIRHAPLPDAALGEILVGIIPEARNCEYCNRTVYEQTINIRYNQNPVPHWDSECTACKRHRNPDTGEFDLTRGELNHYYRKFSGKKDK